MSTQGPRYLESTDVDALARMLNALLAEHWILHDRTAILEQLLVEHGVLSAEAVERYRPSGEFAQRLEALRNTVFANVLGAPFSNESRTVETLRQRQP